MLIELLCLFIATRTVSKCENNSKPSHRGITDFSFHITKGIDSSILTTHHKTVYNLTISRIEFLPRKADSDSFGVKTIDVLKFSYKPAENKLNKERKKPLSDSLKDYFFKNKFQKLNFTKFPTLLHFDFRKTPCTNEVTQLNSQDLINPHDDEILKYDTRNFQVFKFTVDVSQAINYQDLQRDIHTFTENKTLEFAFHQYEMKSLINTHKEGYTFTIFSLYNLIHNENEQTLYFNFNENRTNRFFINNELKLRVQNMKECCRADDILIRAINDYFNKQIEQINEQRKEEILMRKRFGNIIDKVEEKESTGKVLEEKEEGVENELSNEVLENKEEDKQSKKMKRVTFCGVEDQNGEC